MNQKIYKSIPAHIRKRAIDKLQKKPQTIYNAIFYQLGNLPNNFNETIKNEIKNEINNLKQLQSKIS
jgi:hypothetical protein